MDNYYFSWKWIGHQLDYMAMPCIVVDHTVRCCNTACIDVLYWLRWIPARQPGHVRYEAVTILRNAMRANYVRVAYA